MREYDVTTSSQTSRTYDLTALKQVEETAPKVALLVMALATPLCIGVGVLHGHQFLIIWPIAYYLGMVLWRDYTMRVPQQAPLPWVVWGVVLRVAVDLIFLSMITYCLFQTERIIWFCAVATFGLGILTSAFRREIYAPLVYRDRILYGVVFFLFPIALWSDGYGFFDILVVASMSLIGVVAFVKTHERATRDRSVATAATSMELQQRKLQALGQLTGGVAHDFNNLLTVIMGNVQIMRSVNQSRGDDQLLGEIEDAAERAVSLTSQLLSFSRKQDLSPEPTRCRDVVSSGLALMQRILPATHDLDVKLGDHCPPFLVDRAHLQMVLVNLVVNARDAMPDGGTITISLRGETHYQPLQVPGMRSVPAGKYMVISVTDTGCGIPEEDIERVCEPFYTTKPQGKGSGLGLSSAFGFAEQTGGTLTISSAVDVGTRVSLWFPIYEGPMQAGTVAHV